MNLISKLFYYISEQSAVHCHTGMAWRRVIKNFELLLRPSKCKWGRKRMFSVFPWKQMKLHLSAYQPSPFTRLCLCKFLCRILSSSFVLFIYWLVTACAPILPCTLAANSLIHCSSEQVACFFLFFFLLISFLIFR